MEFRDKVKLVDIANKISKGVDISDNLLSNDGKFVYISKDSFHSILNDDLSDVRFIESKAAKKLNPDEYVISGDFIFAVNENGRIIAEEINLPIEFQYLISKDFVVINPNTFLRNYLKISRHKKKLIDEIGHVNDLDQLIEKLENYPIDLNASMSSEQELEVEDVDEKPAHDDVSNGKDELNLSEISMTQKTEALSNILNRIRRNEINLNTKFQRSASLWDHDKKCKLIESIMLDFPIPAFYFDATDDNNWLIIDGLQRLSSIKEFVIDNSLELDDLDFLKELEGKRYDELDRPFQRKIEEFEIVAYKVLPGTPQPIKYNLFKRINSGALKLEDQEIRHALNQGKPAETLIKYAKFPEFKDVIQISEKRIDRMEDREIVLRFFAFRLTNYMEYTGNMKSFLDHAMEKLHNIDDNQLRDLERDFKHSLKTCERIFGEHTFRRSLVDREEKGRRFSKVIYEPWIHAVSKLTVLERNNLAKNRQRVLQIFKGILRGEKNELGYDAQHEFEAFEYNQAYTSKRLKDRFESIERIVKKWAE